VGEEPSEPADFGERDGVVRGREGAEHRDAELDGIGEDDAPKTGGGRVQRRQGAADQDRGVLVHPEQDAGDLDGREVHGGHDHRVEEEPR
jgi:hypothetical protein